MKQKSSAIAQKLVNLYRQAHVIFGGWAAVNAAFVAEATDDVMRELENIPTGPMLARHIENLRSGRTPMDAIERELLPYGGMMAETVATTQLSAAEWNELENALNTFVPDEDGLEKIQNLPVIRKFGDGWLVAIRAALSARPDLMDKWSVVVRTHRAYYLWRIATEILAQPLSERTRAQLQADMPEFETYLPMFGNAGTDLLEKMRAFITTAKPYDTDNAPDAPESI